MKNTITFLLVLICLTVDLNAQKVNYIPSDKILSFDFNSIVNDLNNTSKNSLTINLPLYSGVYDEVLLNIKPISENQPSEIRTYEGKTLKGNYPIKFIFTPSGVSGIYKDEKGYVYFESTDKTNQTLRIYRNNDVSYLGDAICGVFDEALKNKSNSKLKVSSVSPFPIGSSLRSYRMAAAAAAEMYVKLGSKIAVRDKIVAIIGAANLIFELETAITFTLIPESISTMTIIFDDVNTDYYTPATFASATQSQSAFDQMATDLLLPKSNYDIGHSFSIVEIPNACYICGVAGPDPCDDNLKARGMTQFQGTAQVSSIVGLYVHEVGHQFRAWHTFNAMGGSSGSPSFCTGGWSNTTAIEPGSGSTLMGYANNCSYPVNYVLTSPNSEDYFHTKSLEQIFNSVANTAPTYAGSCINSTATGNSPPLSNAGGDFVIPKGTPFTLSGSATDANTLAANLTYTWEQYDLATANDQGALGTSINGVGGYPAVMSSTAPLFRSKLPSNSSERTFPALPFILNNSNNPNDNEGEDLPLVARTMNFRFTVRDNESGGGGIDSDGMIVTVADVDPFLVSSQNGPTFWFQGETKTITWDVNNTDQAPINCSTVNILISTDGGITFTPLVAATANDGTENIIVPNTLSASVRIKIEAIGNIFFDINNVDISISGGTCAAENSQLTDISSVSETYGSANLNLNLQSFGSIINSLTGTIDVNDGTTYLTVQNSNGTCTYFGNSPQYELFEFKAGSNANTTFTTSGSLGSRVMNLYQDSYDNGNVCYNWLKSTAFYTGSAVSNYSSISESLVANNTYLIKLSGFNSGDNGTFTITPSGGSIYAKVPSAGSPYDYTYLVIGSNGNIVNYSSTGDLTAFPPDSYTIYGLSYAGGADLNPYIGTSFSSFQTALNNSSFCGELSSNSKSVTINCNNLPVAPTVNSPTIEYNNNAAIIASNCNGQVKWYSSLSGGSDIFTGFTFTTPNLLTSTSYFAECIIGNCVSTSRSESIVTVNPTPCPETLNLVSGIDDINSGTQTFQTSNTTGSGLIGATNSITGGNTTYDAGKKVEMNPGFKVDSGAVFSAQIGGCN